MGLAYTVKMMHQLADFLGEDYCARCDTFGHIRTTEHGTLQCDCCWDTRLALPWRVRKTIEEVVGVKEARRDG